MGKKKTKTEQTNKPIYSSQILGAANQQQAAYNQAQPMIGQVSSNLGQVSSDLFNQFRQGDPTTQMAQATAQELMQGGPNPYIDQMLDISNDRVRNQLQANLGRRGATGGSDYTNLIARALAENETGVRFNDYNQAQARRLQAAGLAPGLLQGSYLPAQLGAQLGQQGAMLPLQAALANSAGVGGLLGQYQDVRGKQVQSGMGFGELLGAGLQAASLFSDEELKENERKVGETDEGLPIYTYNYKGDNTTQMGVMAQDVKKKQKKALGPVVDGYMTVNYGKVR